MEFEEIYNQFEELKAKAQDEREKHMLQLKIGRVRLVETLIKAAKVRNSSYFQEANCGKL